MLLSDMINRCRKFHDYALHFNDVSLIDFNNNDSFLGNLKLDNDSWLPFAFIKSANKFKDRRSLTVVFSGAVRHGHPRPTFHRISWAEEFRGDCLYIADPELADPSLQLAWYIGKPAANVMQNILLLTNKCKEDICPMMSYAYGSSGGGYAALHLARYTTNFRIISINPQIYICNWLSGPVKSFSNKILGIEKNRLSSDMPEINFACHGLDEHANGNKILVYQNTVDVHSDKHVGLLLKNHPQLACCHNWRFEEFTRQPSHAAEKKSWVKDIFDYVDEWPLERRLRHVERGEIQADFD